jgi:uncharacterized protein YfaS (alpha-2-macroglobulin family)
MEQAKKYWLDFDLQLQADLALALYRTKETALVSDIMRSLKERSKISDELGMYWPSNSGGYFWNQSKLETHCALVEAFAEIEKDVKSVDEMKRWLLMNKQTNHWGTTKATAEACYILLLGGTDWITSTNIPQLTIGTYSSDRQNAEAGTGYFKQSWTGVEIKKDMATVQISNTGKVPCWGALYWQYFEKLDAITSAESPLKVARKLFVERVGIRNSKAEFVSDTTTLYPGDRVKVQLVIETDRDMEYVYLKDLHAAGLEPENVLSGTRNQDGLSYYQNTRDAATHIFIHYLPKGMYVFEYSLLAAQAGSYSNGISSIQCMYAPEFSAHSEGIRLNIQREQ